MGRVFVFLSTLGPIAPADFLPQELLELFSACLVFFHLVFHWNAHPWTIAIFFFPLFITGIFICSEAEKVMGQKKTHLPLSGMNLWPFPIFLSQFPKRLVSKMVIPASFGFFWDSYFRFFDIVKPLGINSLQKVKNGFGVMIDDFLAAAYSALSLLVLKTFPFVFLITLCYLY